MTKENVSPEFENPFAVITHDVPQELVDQVLSHLHDEREATEYTLPQWHDFTKDKPHVRESISRIAHELAPDDIELRQRITQGILGFFAVIREGKIIEVLEHEQELDMTTFITETPIEPAEIFTPNDREEKQKFRIFGNRERKPRVRSINRSLAAFTVMFGLSSRTMRNDE